MPLEIGFIETVNIREVWPTENAAFTPWLQSHIGELDKVLGLGLSNPQREVGGGDFSIDLVAETNFGDIETEGLRALRTLTRITLPSGKPAKP